jgi:hypothetical protein
LVIELAQIEDGGEGVILALGALARRYAGLQGLRSVEWIVHAVDCAKPNLKLRDVLRRRGFVIRDVPGIGNTYHYVDCEWTPPRDSSGPILRGVSQAPDSIYAFALI